MNREEIIEKVLLELGVPHHLKGYTYIKQSLTMIADDKDYRESIVKHLYHDVAKQNNDVPSRVERSIRHAIEKIFKNTDIDVFKKYFGNTIDVRKGKVSNKHFLITIADYILNY
jgi:two-component system response regulator (stage 0 sporulation protein A)